MREREREVERKEGWREGRKGCGGGGERDERESERER
jgi:hypothetical protein